MPENVDQWLWYLFFFFGALGGWWALFETVRLYLLDRRGYDTPPPPPSEDADTEFQFEERTRHNLPVYRPRRRMDHR